jgi:hypothetical protein
MDHLVNVDAEYTGSGGCAGEEAEKCKSRPYLGGASVPRVGGIRSHGIVLV